jgi:hypothetical protein
MIQYGKPNARYAIATDFHEPFEGHPGYEQTVFMHEVRKRFNLLKHKNDFGGQKLGMLLKKGTT